MAIIILGGLILCLIASKGGNNREPDTSEASIKAGLKHVEDKYGKEFAKTIERLYRLETAHFKAAFWKHTATPGMGAFKTSYPWGWTSLTKFPQLDLREHTWITDYRDIGNNNKQIAFSSAELSIRFLAWFITNYRDGNVGQWHSLDPGKAAAYENSLNQITTKYVI